MGHLDIGPGKHVDAEASLGKHPCQKATSSGELEDFHVYPEEVPREPHLANLG